MPKLTEGQPSNLPDFPDDVQWVWVEQPETGHQFDVHRSAVEDGYKIVGGHPFNYGASPRPVKYRTEKDGSPAQRSAPKTTTSGE